MYPDTRLAGTPKADDLVWVHNYHLVPLGAGLRERGARNWIGFFLHIPFPPPDTLVGLRCAALVPDGGTLQIGIGSIGTIGRVRIPHAASRLQIYHRTKPRPNNPETIMKIATM
ncbi:MAG: trehalose-6-phosphate synthase [Methylocystis sp.]|nr:trehalose-6-phosphate synthase [Methylocystis sp.]